MTRVILFVAGFFVGLSVGGAVVFYLANKVADDVFSGWESDDGSG